ncbi:MAG: hypothetical protein R3250_03735 [Melioribacteraceae bacterium]|nr:hypothetical protein [Melioribacteraceae bacterium]
MDDRTEEIIRFVNQFVNTVKSYMVPRIGCRLEFNDIVSGERWMFTLFGQDDNLTLSVGSLGNSYIFSQIPLDPYDENDRKCMSLYDYLQQELINQRLDKFTLEKIMFSLA